MASPIFISNPPPGFSVLAILRGLQLALLGAYRSLQNPALFKSAYYSHVLDAIKYSVMIQLVLWSPVVMLRIFTSFVALLFTLSALDGAAQSLRYFQFNVLNLSVFVIAASRHFSKQLDQLFLLSLQFIDQTYVKHHPEKHSHQYYAPLMELSTDMKQSSALAAGGKFSLKSLKEHYANSQDFSVFVKRHLITLAYSLLVFLLSKLPYVGNIILGLISFQNLNDKIGTERALLIFGVLQIVPKSYSVTFMTTYYGSRSMVHDLLLPYFSRVKFTKREKELWIKAREGLLFGFGLCFFSLIKQFPWVGLLTYGFAESSVAYLVTKVSDPPPDLASKLISWNETQLVWSKEREQTLLSGEFANADEGFSPIPGSFLFSHN